MINLAVNRFICLRHVLFHSAEQTTGDTVGHTLWCRTRTGALINFSAAGEGEIQCTGRAHEENCGKFYFLAYLRDVAIIYNGGEKKSG